MSYVVSWWSGEVRNHRTFTTQEKAEAARVQLKTRSAASVRASFEPIRLMPQPVFEKMEQLASGKNRSDSTCRHKGTQRLCVLCVEGML